jgi:TruD family tRNA pseudouridine synthase
MSNNFSLQQKTADLEKLTKEAENDPLLAKSEIQPQFTSEFLKKIGIDYQPAKVAKGYIKLHWSDFIVEEIAESGRIIDITAKEINLDDDKSGSSNQIGADLIKRGLSTPDAITMMAEKLGVMPELITAAGLKDSRAITAQEISIGGSEIEKIRELKIPNLILKNVHWRKGAIDIGDLKGNKFSILIRTDKKNNQELIEKIQTISSQGFYNFFSLQRFGSRLINTDLGRLIFSGEFETAVKKYLTDDSPYEIGVVRRMRGEAKNYFGDWGRIVEIFKQYPYLMRSEIRLLEALKENNGKYLLGLKGILDQTKLFAYSYGSYYFNKLLSKKISDGEKIPENLPLISSNAEDINCYRDVMSSQEISELKLDQDFLQFLGTDRRRNIPTKIMPRIGKVIEIDPGYITCFALHKGGYATTMLSEIFDLYHGFPVPDWVKTEEIDCKKHLSEESVQNTVEKLTQTKDSSQNIEIEETIE